MNKKCPKIVSLLLSLLLITSLTTGCNSSGNNDVNNSVSGDVPKYIFLLIGDGMSFPQATALSLYDGTVENDFVGTKKDPTINNKPNFLVPSFLQFPVIGAATTPDASKFITDSAAASTALACGVKTVDGALGLDAEMNEVKSIATLLKEQLGYKIGILTSVFMNDATPSGFFSHVESRKMRYEIGLDLVESDFDYFGGGGLKQTTGANEDQKNIYELAEEAGYTIADTREEFDSLNSESGKTIAFDENLDKDKGLQYVIDTKENDLTLSEYLEKGLEVLGDTDPFFMMIESGKVDWAAHANDPMTLIEEVRELDDCVKIALEFAQAHPDETLILVTGDHETGGLSMGFNGTEYDTYASLLANQEISYQKFMDDYIVKFREEKVPFETAMKTVKDLYGLIMPNDPEAATTDTPALILTDREVELLKEGYTASMVPYDERENSTYDYKSEWSMYDYEPFQLRVTHVLSNKAGLGWTSTAHTALPTAVYANGVGQENFDALIDNTDIPRILKDLCEIK